MTHDVEIHPAAGEVAQTLFKSERFTSSDVKLLHQRLRAVPVAERSTVATHLVALAIMAQRAWHEAARPIVEALAELVVFLIGDATRASELFQRAGLERAAQKALGTQVPLRARNVEKQAHPRLRLLANGGGGANGAP